MEIYEEAVDALLKKWDARRRVRRGEEPYKQLSLGRKRQMLARIAAQSFDDGQFLLPERKLIQMIEAYMEYVPGMEDTDVDGGAILQSIAARHGIFVEQAHAVYSFAHLSFQEYFTAKYIVSNVRQGTLERLLDHVTDDQWDEVFLLTVSLLDDDVDDFFALFIERLNGISAKSKEVQQLLTWAQEQAETAAHVQKLAFKPVSVRAWYLALDLGYTLDIDLDPDPGYANAIVAHLDHNLDRTIAHDLDLELALDLDLDRTINHNLFPDLAQGINSARKLTQQLGYLDLNKVLNQMSAFEPDEEMDSFFTSLSEVVQQIQERSGYTFLKKSMEGDVSILEELNWDALDKDGIYTDYLRATGLLVECLPLAMVRDRVRIEEQLLRPVEV